MCRIRGADQVGRPGRNPAQRLLRCGRPSHPRLGLLWQLDLSAAQHAVEGDPRHSEGRCGPRHVVPALLQRTQDRLPLGWAAWLGPGMAVLNIRPGMAALDAI